MLSSERLHYELLAEKHAEVMFSHLQDPRIYDFIPEDVPASIRRLAQGFRDFENGAPRDSDEIWINYAIYHVETKEFIGILQATTFCNGELWIGYKIFPMFWNKGFGKEALQWLTNNLHSRFNQPILAAVDSNNHASIRILEKCNYTKIRSEPAELKGVATLDYIFIHEKNT